MANLKTDYKDDILDSTQNTRRKFRMITNDDGTFSFEDVTDYLQYGDSFGALDLNAITNAIMNECLKRTDVVDNLESTETKLPLSANMGRELKENLIKYTSTSLSITTLTKTVVNGKGTAVPPSDEYVCVSAQVGYVGGVSGVSASVVYLPEKSTNYEYNVAMYDNGAHIISTQIVFTWVKKTL